MDNFDTFDELFTGEDAAMFKPKAKKHVATPDSRLAESFAEITAFVRDNGYPPIDNGGFTPDDIKEAGLAVRLAAIRGDKKQVEILTDYDELGLLEFEKAPESFDELFSENSGLFNDAGLFDISSLPRAAVEDKQTGDIAKREPVADFGPYKALFDSINDRLAVGTSKLTKFRSVNEIELHGFYVVDGLMCYVESIGEATEVFGRQKERLRVVFINGVESDMYLRTLASQLYEESGFRVVNADYEAPVDTTSSIGRIYVLESLSEDPKIRTIANLHKIGVTHGTVEGRIKNAVNEPTYLMAPVKIVEDYRLTGEYNPQKVEALIHQIFGSAQIDVGVTGLDGNYYSAIEWYSVPISVINEAIALIDSGEIKDYHYSPSIQKLVEN
jgi:hypothetical protein